MYFRTTGNLCPILSEWVRIRQDPLGEAQNQLVGIGIGYAARLLPPVGAGAFMYQALQFSAWLGDVANVAGYARNDDEIDLAARLGSRAVRGRSERPGEEGAHPAAEREAPPPGTRPATYSDQMLTADLTVLRDSPNLWDRPDR